MKMPIATAKMAIENTMVTTVPEVVRELSRSIQMSLPAVSVWQMTPGAQEELAVAVGAQPREEERPEVTV